MDLVLPALAATTGDAPADATEEEKTASAVESQIRRLVKVSEFDLRPAFLYFHYPHDEDEKDRKLTPEGRISKKECGFMGDEKVARWAMLFRCFEVDMSKSDRKTAERLGAAEGTSFSVVGGKTQVIAQAGPFAGAAAAAQFLEGTLKNASPDLWADIQKRLEEQRVIVAEARKLAEKREWKPALERYDLVVKSDLRVGDFYDDVVKEWQKVTIKAAADR